EEEEEEGEEECELGDPEHNSSYGFSFRNRKFIHSLSGSKALSPSSSSQSENGREFWTTAPCERQNDLRRKHPSNFNIKSRSCSDKPSSISPSTASEITSLMLTRHRSPDNSCRSDNSNLEADLDITSHGGVTFSTRTGSSSSYSMIHPSSLNYAQIKQSPASSHSGSIVSSSNASHRSTPHTNSFQPSWFDARQPILAAPMILGLARPNSPQNLTSDLAYGPSTCFMRSRSLANSPTHSALPANGGEIGATEMYGNRYQSRQMQCRSKETTDRESNPKMRFRSNRVSSSQIGSAGDLHKCTSKLDFQATPESAQPLVALLIRAGSKRKLASPEEADLQSEAEDEEGEEDNENEIEFNATERVETVRRSLRTGASQLCAHLSPRRRNKD
ncbi:unnamed protein product, partial [Protopolystoma xenopodis]